MPRSRSEQLVAEVTAGAPVTQEDQVRVGIGNRLDLWKQQNPNSDLQQSCSISSQLKGQFFSAQNAQIEFEERWKKNFFENTWNSHLT